MTDRPILFSAPMVRALLDGRKTMTRRLAWQSYRTQKLQPLSAYATRASPWQSVEPGDRLWVRETWMTAMDAGGPDWRYAADYDAEGVASMRELQSWCPSIHMPRWASRLTLVVTAVQVERLQEIDGLDALAEGITREEGVAPWRTFYRLWNSLHGDGAWQANPEVVALTYTVHKCNIDRVEQAA